MSFATAPLWYLTRATGLVSFVLLTLTTALGVASTQRALASRSWPRFATQRLHRNVALLGGVLLLVHIVTTIVDSYVNMGWLSAVVPGASHYKTASVALGTFAFDLLLLIVGTSLLRVRLSARAWRAVHWTAYAVWPLSLLHFVRTGTDAGTAGGRLLALGSLAVVLVAGWVRLSTTDRPRPLRTLAGSAR